MLFPLVNHPAKTCQTTETNLFLSFFSMKRNCMRLQSHLMRHKMWDCIQCNASMFQIKWDPHRKAFGDHHRLNSRSINEAVFSEPQHFFFLSCTAEILRLNPSHHSLRGEIHRPCGDLLFTYEIAKFFSNFRTNCLQVVCMQFIIK